MLHPPEMRRTVVTIAITIALLLAWIQWNRPPSAPRGNAQIISVSPAEAQKFDRVAGSLAERCSDASIGVLRDGKLAYANAWGKGNSLEKKHEWASVSKPVTALLVMQAVERGEVDLDAPIVNYAPAYAEKIPEKRRSPALTLRHLLGHRGGLTSEKYRAEAKMFFRSPGSYWYSSNGYGVIGDVLRARSSVPLPEQFITQIAEKAGAPGLALARDTFVAPASLVRSNTLDFAAFAEAILANKLVSAETLASMTTPVVVFANELKGADRTRRMLREPRDRFLAGVLAIGEGSRPTAYGLGFELRGEGEDRVIAHTGTNGKRRAMLYLQPEQQRGFVAFCTSKKKLVPQWWRIADEMMAGL